MALSNGFKADLKLEGLGHKQGVLTPCPDSPNCICSQTDPTDAKHYLEPQKVNENPIPKIVQYLSNLDRVKILNKEHNYVYAAEKTPLIGYVDDIEFYYDAEANLLHFRSASRLGRSDLGANRKRLKKWLTEIHL